MINRDMGRMESECKSRNYAITVDVDASGQTLVTLKHNVKGHRFRGVASARATSAYLVALKMAYDRMLLFETRFDNKS